MDSALEPLPDTPISMMLGLAELIADRGGREDVYRLARDLQMPFAKLLLAIRGAEMLGLIETPGADAVLTALGKKALALPMSQKKALLGGQIGKLRIVEHVLGLLARAPGHSLDAEVVTEELTMLLPFEPPRALFHTLVTWGRYGEVLGYSRDTGRVYLLEPAAQA